MDDGIVLRADVFLPLAAGRHPVILSYGPYGKGLAFQDGNTAAWERLLAAHPGVAEGSSNASARRRGAPGTHARPVEGRGAVPHRGQLGQAAVRAASGDPACAVKRRLNMAASKRSGSLAPAAMTASCVLAVCCAASGAASAQAYPVRLVRVIVPFPPGSAPVQTHGAV